VSFQKLTKNSPNRLNQIDTVERAIRSFYIVSNRLNQSDTVERAIRSFYIVSSHQLIDNNNSFFFLLIVS